MTARERAREVVIQVYKPGNYKTVYITCADAASDVWEPLLKAFLDSKEGENEFGDFWNTSRLRAAMNQAKEALGE